MAMLLLFVGSGILIVGFGIPLAMGRVPPNRLYGLRVRQTLRSETTWYAANARAGGYLMVAGIAVVASAVLVFALGVQETRAAAINISVLLISVLAACFRGSRVARDLDAGGNSDRSSV